ncbi:TonB-dependent receptor [Mucilaginibacter sp. 14171R-50]|uniref:outer membrane beta-barrel family protein n=1 Tax=Mucilaginibacter sp. 14171R-50 TaxID=2703789 RepID=UPI00138B6A2F|nr:outer membrane beta-barrel family protein [Mucilaginibacter sp. 14171R-50]QHS54049.1 TonB-dependent receptor [Mucilaginibacter sp. 14171R-50]
MRVKFGCFFIAVLAGLFNFCYAQTGASAIRGSVFLQNNQPADAATVILLSLPDSAVVMSALVTEQGAYQFSDIKPGNYLILTTRLGYKKVYSKNYTLATGQVVTAVPIILSPASNELKEISIVAKKPFIEVRPGKMVINPASSIISAGQSVLDILRQSPGVRVGNNDNVSINGRQDALVLIDGKATNLTGAELAALLKSTQGSSIDKVEVLTGGSAKYDAAAGGIINIIYKKGTNIGTNGTFSASAGYGRYYKANTGLTFNHRAAFYNIFGSYNVSANKTWKQLYTGRGINYAGLQSNYNTTYNSVQEYQNHNFRLGTDFFLSPGNSIGFLISGLVNNNTFDKNNTLAIFNRGMLDSTILANSTIDRDISNINYNINYTSVLDKAGKALSANFTYTRANRHSAEYITNRFFDGDGSVYRDPLLLQNISPTKMKNWTALLAYSNPLPKDAKFDAGFKFSRTVSDNNLVFGPQINGIYTADPAYTNYFIFTENVGAAYVNYTGKFGKLSLDGGLRGEYTRNNGNSVTNNTQTARNYFNVFPTVLLSYSYNDKNEYSISFTRGIERPTYDKLNPFLSFLDLYNYQAGNPYLLPDYSNTLRLSHTYNQETVTSLYATLLTGAAFPFYEQDDASKVILTTDVNLGRVYTYGLNLGTPFKFTSWWSSRYDIDASYQKYVAYRQYGTLNKGTGDLIVQWWQNFAISSTLAAELSGRYETATFYGINNVRPNYYVDAGISKQIFNKLGKLSLAVNDIFKTNQDRVFTNYQNLDRVMTDRREYRKVTLSFSYRFGKTSVKGAASHVTGSEDEQKRMRLNN